MERDAIKKLRKRQIILINLLLLFILSVYFTVVMTIFMTSSQMNAIVGVIIFFYGLYGYVRKDKPTSFIPTFEKVAIYEKEKMGDEWNKQRKTNVISLFILSGIMLLNAVITSGGGSPAFTIDIFPPVLILVVVVILVMNLFTIIHIRKVDRSKSKADFAGYTLNMNIISIAVGIGITIVSVVLIILYFIVTK